MIFAGVRHEQRSDSAVALESDMPDHWWAIGTAPTRWRQAKCPMFLNVYTRISSRCSSETMPLHGALAGLDCDVLTVLFVQNIHLTLGSFY